MNISTEQLKKFGKKAGATAVGILAAVSLALGAVVDSPDELFSGTPQAAQVVISAEQEQDRAAVSTLPAEPAKKERLRYKLRRLLLSQASVVRGIILLPFWALGKVLLSLLSLLLTALSPALQIILSVLFNALLLFGLFMIVLKLLFPNLRMKDLLTRKNILLLIAGSLILSGADAILRMFWEDYLPISIAIKLCAGLIVLSLLCWRIFGKRSRQEAVPS